MKANSWEDAGKDQRHTHKELINMKSGSASFLQEKKKTPNI